MPKLNITNFYEVYSIFYADKIIESENAYEITYYSNRVIDNHSNEIKFVTYYIYKDLTENNEVRIECNVVRDEYEQLSAEDGKLMVTPKKIYYSHPQNVKSDLLRLIAKSILIVVDEY
jgi:hypothetical protein